MKRRGMRDEERIIALAGMAFLSFHGLNRLYPFELILGTATLADILIVLIEEIESLRYPAIDG